MKGRRLGQKSVCVAGVECPRRRVVPVLLKAGCCLGRGESDVSQLRLGGGWKKHLPPFAEGASDIGLGGHHMQEPVWRSWFTVSLCSEGYKGSELTFKEAALLFLLRSCWWLWSYFGVLLGTVAYMCSVSPMPGQSLNSQGVAGRSRAHRYPRVPEIWRTTCVQSPPALWRAKTMQASTVPLVVLLFPVSWHQGLG